MKEVLFRLETKIQILSPLETVERHRSTLDSPDSLDSIGFNRTNRAGADAWFVGSVAQLAPALLGPCLPGSQTGRRASVQVWILLVPPRLLVRNESLGSNDVLSLD